MGRWLRRWKFLRASSLRDLSARNFLCYQGRSSITLSRRKGKRFIGQVPNVEEKEEFDLTNSLFSKRWKRKDFELEARLPFNRLQTLIFGFLFFSTDAEITFVFLADE